MEKEHFEILLERIESNFQLVFERFDFVDERLDRLEAGHAAHDDKFAKIEAHLSVHDDRLDRLEAGQESLITDVQEIKRKVSQLQAIANDHESRFQ